MASRLTLVQTETLVEFLEQNPGIAKGLLRTSYAKRETKRKWASLSTTLNSLGGASKDGQGWAKYWAEKKCALKKLCAQQRDSVRRTGGGPGDELPTLSPLDTRLVAVMGGQEFAFGDSQLAVDPFPQSTQQAQSSTLLLAPLSEDINIESVVTRSCLSPIAGPSRDAQLQTPPPRTRSQPRPTLRTRQHRSVSRRNAEDMDRLAQIEERRVSAEAVTAQAFADVATALERNAVAVEHMANSITQIARAQEALSSIANAILEVAKAMQK